MSVTFIQGKILPGVELWFHAKPRPFNGNFQVTIENFGLFPLFSLPAILVHCRISMEFVLDLWKYVLLRESPMCKESVLEQGGVTVMIGASRVCLLQEQGVSDGLMIV
jgi:hypothetical protein